MARSASCRGKRYFSRDKKLSSDEAPIDMKMLHAKIGELTLENDFLEGTLTKQAKVLGISRGSVYYRPRPLTDTDLGLMRRIEELHLNYPLAGNRMLRGLLLVEGYKVRRLHVRTLMKRMGIEAIYRRSNTSKPAPSHKIYPCLLRKLPVIRPN